MATSNQQAAAAGRAPPSASSQRYGWRRPPRGVQRAAHLLFGGEVADQPAAVLDAPVRRQWEAGGLGVDLEGGVGPGDLLGVDGRRRRGGGRRGGRRGRAGRGRARGRGRGRRGRRGAGRGAGRVCAAGSGTCQPRALSCGMAERLLSCGASGRGASCVRRERARQGIMLQPRHLVLTGLHADVWKRVADVSQPPTACTSCIDRHRVDALGVHRIVVPGIALGLASVPASPPTAPCVVPAIALRGQS
jgi:hypothetical protein